MKVKSIEYCILYIGPSCNAQISMHRKALIGQIIIENVSSAA